jgi:hypothetical protein
MDREKIIGVLYIMTFLLAAYIKFTNPHFFATTSTKGIHDAANVTYLGQFYVDRLIWSVPVKQTELALTLWREVYVAGDPPRVDQTFFQSEGAGKRVFALKKDESSVQEQTQADPVTAVRLYPYKTEAVRAEGKVVKPAIEFGLRDKIALGTYKISLEEGSGANVAKWDTVFTLAEKDVGKVFFRRQFKGSEAFAVRLWKKVNLNLPEVSHKLLGKIKKKIDNKNEEFYSLNYDELTIDLDKSKVEKARREVVAADREVMLKLFAENSRLAGTYSFDVSEKSGKIHFESHIFEIAPKVEFSIVYPDFDAKPEQLAGVPYRDFVVTSQPMDDFVMIVSDRGRVDSLVGRITTKSGQPEVRIIRTTGIESTPGFNLQVNQDRKIVSFGLPLKTPKTFHFIAHAGRAESKKSWQVPIRRLSFAVWPPIQPRYWHSKEKDLYNEFYSKHPTHTEMSPGATAPLLYEGRAVSVYYDVENVDRNAFTDIMLRFSNQEIMRLKKGAPPIELTLPIDIEWVELTVKTKETTLSSVFGVKPVPETFTYDVDLSPPLEMVSEYGMSTFQIRDFFGEAVRTEAFNVEITGAPPNLVRMNKSDKDRIKLELIGIKNNHNIRARLVLLQSPYGKNNRNVEIGRIALKN